MSELKETSIALKVRLNPSELSAHPRMTNYTTVNVAQGMAYLDCGFIEPTLLASVAETAKGDPSAPQRLGGHLVARVAMDVNALAFLHRQIQLVLIRLRDVGKAAEPKGSE